jgi:hypothetical protein
LVWQLHGPVITKIVVPPNNYKHYHFILFY